MTLSHLSHRELPLQIPAVAPGRSPIIGGTPEAAPSRPAEPSPKAAPSRPAEPSPKAAPARPAEPSPVTVPAWPAEPSPVVRGDWRERLALATDLAMIGVVATVLALPLITAPAALAAGSVAVRARYRDGRIPPWRSLTAAYRRGVLPGMTALPAVALLALDLAAVRGGRVPGGTPLFAVTTVAAIWLTGVGTLTLAMLGRALPWREAARQAWNRPWCASALAVINLVAVFLALTVPATIPLVIGFHLFAAHMLADRLAPPLV